MEREIHTKKGDFDQPGSKYFKSYFFNKLLKMVYNDSSLKLGFKNLR